MEKYDSLKDTMDHIFRVQKLGANVVTELNHRFIIHDRSKTEEPEKAIFDEFTPKLKAMTYGSYEYKQSLEFMGAALDHHYAHNPHHPEFFKDGIKDMSLVDMLEMLVDWLAASERHADGNIGRSIKLNAKRFNYGHELERMFVNTILAMFKYTVEIGMTDGTYGIYYGNTVEEFHANILRDASMTEWHNVLINGYYKTFKNEEGVYEYQDTDATIDNGICIYWCAN